MKLICTECALEFEIDKLSGKAEKYNYFNLCCPNCQAKVKER